MRACLSEEPVLGGVGRGSLLRGRWRGGVLAGERGATDRALFLDVPVLIEAVHGDGDEDDLDRDHDHDEEADELLATPATRPPCPGRTSPAAETAAKISITTASAAATGRMPRCQRMTRNAKRM